MTDTTRMDPVCEFCEEAFSSKEELNNHRKTHFCDKPKPELKTYSRKVYAKNNRVRPCKETIYVCTRCRKTFSDLSELKSHERQHEQSHICQVCTQPFSEYDSLKEHEKMHFDLSLDISDMNQLKPGLKTYSCKGNAGSETVSNKKRHACSTCGESYFSLTELKTHELEHTGGSKKFKCQVCGQKFSEANVLLEHAQIHIGEMFNCEICQTGFSSLCDLDVHLRIHTREIVCEICKEAFRTADELVKHNEDVHYSKMEGAAPPDDKHWKEKCRRSNSKKVYSCEVCGKIFKYIERYYLHCRIHGKKEPAVRSMSLDKTRKVLQKRRRKKQEVSKRLGSNSSIQDRKINLVSQRHLKIAKKNNRIKVSKKLEFDKHSNGRIDTTRVDAMCEFCEEAFSSKKELNKHRKTHFCDEPDPEPQIKTYSQEVYAKNNQVKSCKETIYVCTRCRKTFSDLHELMSHESQHDQSYSCQLCTEQFLEYDALKEHEKIHFDLFVDISDMNQLKPGLKTYFCKGSAGSETVTNKKRHACGTCGESFLSLIELKAHELEHIGGSESYKCQVCGQAFSEANILLEHGQIHVGKIFNCEICQNVFSTVCDLEAHLQIHTRKIVCEICKEAFKTANELVKHNEDVHYFKMEGAASPNDEHCKEKCSKRNRKKVYSSEVCGEISLNISEINQLKPGLKTYSSKGSVGRKIVKNVKRHACVTCSECFFSLTELKAHELEHIGGLEKFKCEVCGQTFSEASILLEHAQIHLGEMFNCEICQSGFSTLCDLEAHFRIHTREIVCEICKEAFRTADELVKHNEDVHYFKMEDAASPDDKHWKEKCRKSNSRKVYSCEVCGKIFKNLVRFYLHYRIHGKNEPIFSRASLDKIQMIV